jgi:hypothetical protein
MAGRNIDPEKRKRPYEPRDMSARNREYLKGPRPNVWRSGPDETRHDQYIAWGRHRAQAMFRGEGHELSYQDWCKIWDKNGHWHNRGRTMSSSVLTRRDSNEPWSKKNCVIITRSELHNFYMQQRRGMRYRTRNAKNKDQ